MTVNFQAIPNPLPHTPLVLDAVPQLTATDYQVRIDRLWKASGDRFTHIVVYGDREHFSNLEYLTGYDPRFEEALLGLTRDGKKPAIIVGCEGMDYATRIPFPIDRILFAPMGLVGQASAEKTFKQAVLEAGVTPGAKIGLIGWKYFKPANFAAPELQTEAPWYMVETLREIAGSDCFVNAAALLMDNETGLRHQLEAKELVLQEIAGTKSSRAAYHVLANLREGMNEVQAAAYLGIDGTPLGTHANVNFGWENVRVGLASPNYHATLHRGDALGAGVGYRRSLCHRAGVYVGSEKEMLQEQHGCEDAFYKPYFAAVAAWYEALAIGATGGDVYAAVVAKLGSLSEFGVGLNPGHLIHTEEWSNSPFDAGVTEKLPNGVAIQCDFTAAHSFWQISAHAEDGVILADAALQAEIHAVSPASLSRMLARREFMREKLGINVRDEVLPTSDMPGWYTPYLANLETVMSKK